MSEPVKVANWLLIIYERKSRFNEQTAGQMIRDFVDGCVAVGRTSQVSSTGRNDTKDQIGIKINPEPVLVSWESGQGIIAHVSRFAAYLVCGQLLRQQLSATCNECQRKTKAAPSLIVAILPDGGDDIYASTKK
jgi:eukaryotic translation initiation factor 2C